MRLIYLAGPYTSADPEILKRRAAHHRHCAAYFANTASNICLFSPIAHWSTTAEEHSLPHTVDFWIEQDFHMIKLASAIWVLPLEGWEKSYGLELELEYAETIQKPVQYLLATENRYFLTNDPPKTGLPLR